jgi:hypothetical protein
MAVAVCIEKPRIIVRRTCASGTGIPKGTLVQISSSPNTVTATSGDHQVFGGITTEEKVATETDIVSIACALDGVWDIDTTAAAIAVGILVDVGGANSVVAAADADFEAGTLVGRAEEVRDGSNRIRVRLMGF